jgi:inorganic pyrophosphatase
MARKAATRRARPKSLDRLEPFEDGCVLVVIETPKGSPNKLAFEARFGTFVLKGVLPAGAVFPFDFGLVPSTRAEDGDPLDVLVLMDAPVFPGCVVPSDSWVSLKPSEPKTGRPNGTIEFWRWRQTTHRSIRELRDLSPDLVAQIEHFFAS